TSSSTTTSIRSTGRTARSDRPRFPADEFVPGTNYLEFPEEDSPMNLVRTIAAAALAAIAFDAAAQQYPTNPVKIIVAFTPGSATDIIARLLADSFTKSMGQTFVVENKAGAGGIIGTESAKNAPPDGYTLTACPSGPFGINPGIYSKLPYDPVK